MNKLSKPYLGGNVDLSSMFSYRDSRHAFGHRYQVYKSDRDWLYGVAALVAFCLAVVVMAGKL